MRVATARYFRVAYASAPGGILEHAESSRVQALCFEFDRPGEAGLRALQAALHAHPRLPALMLTVEHSEALAVWAFRAGVWNYLVRPVAPGEFSDNVEALARAALRGATRAALRPPNAALPGDAPVTPTDARVAQLQPALQYVREHLQERVTETEAANRCGLRRFAFSRAFHAAFGITFREHVMRSRIGEARRLLAEGGHAVTEVALASGFTDASYFARAFKRHTGMLPSEYATERKSP